MAIYTDNHVGLEETVGNMIHLEFEFQVHGVFRVLTLSVIIRDSDYIRRSLEGLPTNSNYKFLLAQGGFICIFSHYVKSERDLE